MAVLIEVRSAPPLPQSVTIRLTGEEALFLRSLLGGYVYGTGRWKGSNDSIWSALKDIPGLKSDKKPAGITGVIEVT